MKDVIKLELEKRFGSVEINDLHTQWRLQGKATWAIALGPAPYKGPARMQRLTDLTPHIA